MWLEFYNQFIDIRYWFASYPGPLAGKFLLLVQVVIIGGIVGGIGALIIKRMWVKDSLGRTIVGRFGAWGATLAFMFGVSFIFSQTQTPVLGSRFWFLLWLLIGIIWLVRLIYWLLKVVPKQRRQQLERARQSRYWPVSR
ncbi:MAG: hypothetical protein WC621_00155 [Patescibacteria group bacterium]